MENEMPLYLIRMIRPRRTLPLFALACVLIGGFAVGCEEDDPTEPGDDSLVLPALTSPENVITAMQVVYNDRTHGPIERFEAYATLLTNDLDPPERAFKFIFQPSDIQNGLPPSWGRPAELAAHEAIFNAQSAGDIYSLELRITHDASQDLTPPEVGREGWKELFATSVYLRLMFNNEDGLELNGAQAEFKFPPPADGKFRIAEWIDLPRPGLAGRSAVEPTTWGRIKANYNRPLGRN
jgi:hypothetical protein